MKTMVILLLLALLPVGCGGQKEKKVVEKGITVSDFRGASITLQQPAKRVVCLIESALSGIYMLGAQHFVVGVPTSVYRENVAAQYALLDERLRRREIPAPGNWDFVNTESLIALQPDLVIIWASQGEAVDNIERFGIPVYGVMLKSLQDVFKEIEDLGVLLDKKERAGQLIEHTKAGLKIFESQLPEARKKKIYFMWSQGLLHTSGKNSTVNQILEAAGAVNACQLEREHVTVNLETLLDWQPDLIVMWHNDRLEPEDIISDSRLQTLPAVRRKQVYELPSVFYCDMWTLKFQYVINMVARWSYPQRFSAIDLPQEKKRMLRLLYGERAGVLLE